MFKRTYLLAILSLLMIPAVTVVGGLMINFIDPEIAVRSANYERNFWLLRLVKSLSMLTLFLANMGLWLLACFFLLKSKQRSYGWLPLAMLGPFGLTILIILSNNAPTPADLYRQFIGKLKLPLRVAYELCFFVANALAKAIGVPANRITAILKDERGITGDTAIRLGTFFKTSAEFWMNLQMTYDLRNAEKALPTRVR